jgi:ABC-type uncharacterized transport system substrate-binding protein
MVEPVPDLEGIEVDAPQVGIVMGSKSDLERMEAAEKELIERGIRCEVRVMSAHREPDKVADYARNARMRGLRVIIAGAGLSAALPGVVAAHSDLPVCRPACRWRASVSTTRATPQCWPRASSTAEAAGTQSKPPGRRAKDR